MITAASACIIASPAAAQNWWDPSNLIHNGYVQVDGGATFQGRTKVDIAANGLGTSDQSSSLQYNAFGDALAGYKITKNISIEAEGLYTRNRYADVPNNAVFGDGGAVRTYGGLGNVKVTLPYTMQVRQFGITPYLSAGVGYGEVRYTGVNGAFAYQSHEGGFLYQGKAGLEIKTGEHLAFDVGYRYLQLPGYNTPGSFENTNYSAFANTHVQAATLGVKYSF